MSENSAYSRSSTSVDSQPQFENTKLFSIPGWLNLGMQNLDIQRANCLFTEKIHIQVAPHSPNPCCSGSAVVLSSPAKCFSFFDSQFTETFLTERDKQSKWSGIPQLLLKLYATSHLHSDFVECQNILKVILLGLGGAAFRASKWHKMSAFFKKVSFSLLLKSVFLLRKLQKIWEVQKKCRGK